MSSQPTRSWARPAVVTTLALVIVSAYACASLGRSTHCDDASAAECVQPGAPFALDPKQGRYVAPGLLRIELSTVKEDSRCAIGVQCVWQGRASVELTLDSLRGAQVVFHLRTDSATAAHFGYVITLDSLLPYPRAGTRIEQSRYRAWLRVTPVADHR
jgi:hypothetical protein